MFRNIYTYQLTNFNSVQPTIQQVQVVMRNLITKFKQPRLLFVDLSLIFSIEITIEIAWKRGLEDQRTQSISF